jgi:5'-methylthioinosine phosphorylase
VKTVAIIGGSGLTEFDELEIIQRHAPSFFASTSDLGAPSSEIVEGRLNGVRLLFLARHGLPNVVPPHKINYRANLLALQELGAEYILAVNAVGGIHPDAIAGHISVPHQIIDYTHGREHTFFDGIFNPLDHIDFTYPYDESLRKMLIEGLSKQVLSHGYSDFGIYGATQGPRLETLAEINRLEKDGCDLVGMTGMPEAALARELSIPYASVCLTVNLAAGKGKEMAPIEEIREVLQVGMDEIKTLLKAIL